MDWILSLTKSLGVVLLKPCFFSRKKVEYCEECVGQEEAGVRGVRGMLGGGMVVKGGPSKLVIR